MPEELASTRATGGKNKDQDQDPRHWGCNQLLPRVETDSPHPTELRWNLPTTSKERCFPYPDLDRIKTLKHVYTDVLSLPGSLHGTLTSVGGVNQSVLTPYIWGPWVVSPLRSRLARRPTRRAGTDTSSTTTEGSLQTARPSLTQGRAPAHCPQPGAQRRMRRGAAGGGGGADAQIPYLRLRRTGRGADRVPGAVLSGGPRLPWCSASAAQAQAPTTPMLTAAGTPPPPRASTAAVRTRCRSCPSPGGCAPSTARTPPACTPPVARLAPPARPAPSTTTSTCTSGRAGSTASSASCCTSAAASSRPRCGARWPPSSACSTWASASYCASSSSCRRCCCCWAAGAWTSASSTSCWSTAST
uniref:Uncharacterized protein n=1 Tax=Bos mutus grunniens TaxID=30521 RepID=A0A8C0AJZ3_BOSMU